MPYINLYNDLPGIIGILIKILKKMKFVLVVIFLISLSAEAQVTVQLRQPPPNQLGVGDMWNLELTNTTDNDIKIYLTGTATEEKDGLIIEGKSKVFTIKPGRSNYKYNDFSSAEVKYNNGKYKEIILRTGNAPEGSYTICVTAFDEGGTEVGRENCIMQSVQQMGSITLLTPGDGEEIDPGQPVIFSWTPMKEAKEYTLKIVEIRGDQSPEVAVIQNKPFFEKKGIRTTTLQQEKNEMRFEDGKKYVWIVKSKKIESNIFVLKVITKLDSITPCEFTDDYSNPSPWTVIQTSYSGNPCGTACQTHTAIGTIQISLGVCLFNNAECGCDIRTYRNIGNVLINQESWEANFDFNATSTGNTTPVVGHPIWTLSSGILNPMNDNTSSNFCCLRSNQDAVMVWYSVPANNPSAIGLRIGIKEGLNFLESSNFIPISLNATYYIQLTRLNLVNYMLYVFTDAARTNQLQGSPISFTPSNNNLCLIPKNLNTLQHSNSPGGSITRILSGWIDNTCIKVIPPTLPSLNCDFSIAKDTFCLNENIIVDGSPSEDETDYYWKLQESDINWHLGPEIEGWYFAQQSGQIDLKKFATDRGMILKPNTFYIIKLGIRNACVSQWIEKDKLIYIQGFIADAGPDTLNICCDKPFGTIVLGSPKIVNYNYSWSSHPPGKSVTTSKLSLSLTDVKSYEYFDLTVTDVHTGCSSSDRVYIQYHRPIQRIEIVKEDISFCEVRLTANPIFIHEEACLASDSSLPNINEIPSGQGKQDILDDNSLSYLWNTGQTTKSILVPTSNTALYTVTVTGPCNQSSSQFLDDGCPAYRGDFYSIWAPNAFIPDNGDYFSLVSSGAPPFIKPFNATEWLFTVFDRWGLVLYQEQGSIQNRCSGLPQKIPNWNGKNSNGNDIPIGVYNYKLYLKNCDHTEWEPVNLGNGSTIGSVTLIR